MQLGELQNQIERFNRRDTSILAVSVDAPTDSLAMIERLGLTFRLGSDPDQQVVKAFGVQNPDTRELALHAVYIVDTDGKIFYRKVARRRPVSAELIDAIDAHQGTYPRNDSAAPRQRITVAYPQNNFQAIMEIAAVDALPKGIDPGTFEQVQQLAAARRSDDALFAFKRMIEAAVQQRSAAPETLYATAAWLIRSNFYADAPAVIASGGDLRRRVNRVRQLEQQELDSRGSNEHDTLLHTLAAARAGLTRVRADINSNAQAWNLRYAKASLRSYREVVRAALAGAGSAATAAAN